MNQSPPPNPPTFSFPPAASPAKTSALAIWSLVLGILSLLCFYILTAIPAVICGHVALSRIKRSGGGMTGGGLAIGGLVTGYIGIAISIFVLPLLVAIAIPNFVKARDMAQTNVCINNLRMIEAAKEQWVLEHKKADGDIPTQKDLLPYLRGGVFPVCLKGGVYTIHPAGEPPTCSVAGHKLPATTP